MSYNINKHRSRRHLAALTFLSNISLDGTHRDTNLGRYYNIDKSLLNKEKHEKENQPSISNVYISDNCRKIQKENREKSNLKESLTIHSDAHLSSSAETLLNEPTKRRCTPSDANEQLNLLSKHSGHHISLVEKANYLSSNESIGIYTGNTGTAGRARKLSLTLSDVSVPTNRDIKCLRIEDGRKFIKDHRLVFLTKNKIPCHVFSCIPFHRTHRQECIQKDGVRKRNTSGTRPLSTISDSIDPLHIIGLSYFEEISEISFTHLLIPSKGFFLHKRVCHIEHGGHNNATEKIIHHPVVTRCFSFEPPSIHRTTGSRSSSFSVSGNKVLYKPMEASDNLWRKSNFIFSSLSNTLLEKEEIRLTSNQATSEEYIPNMLDDPELRAGKHRKLLRFPSYMTSVTDYTKPFELKKELNDKFREKFPLIQLTLSKLRSLKRELLKIARQECGIDILTVALGYVYFEKMILKMLVNKQNRKLVAGACLILSAKMNDVKGDVLTNLIEKTETVLRLNRRDLLSWELACLVALEFGLHVPTWQVNPHYQRLLFES